MSITITCEFQDLQKAHHATQRLRRRGFMVTGPGEQAQSRPLLVAGPLNPSALGTPGNQLMGGLPPMAGSAILAGSGSPRLSVLTDDTRAAFARDLLEALGGHILS